MKPFRTLCLLIAVSALSACAASTPPLLQPMPRPPVPANLQRQCPPIDPVATDDWDVLARAYIELILDYGECAARVDASVQR